MRVNSRMNLIREGLMSDDQERVLKVLKAIADMIVESAKDAGSMGVPSGYIYAALMSFSLSLHTYQGILDGLVQAKKIKVSGHVIYYLPESAT